MVNIFYFRFKERVEQFEKRNYILNQRFVIHVKYLIQYNKEFRVLTKYLKQLLGLLFHL